uniref:ATP synthase complex subunit 8 n=1 Tax=Glaucidium brodiei brodiei TaxID=1664683 RepID=A0A141BHH3_9STRI|nr:ATP synthase F0 subunit 8 [Glaucidium brodiei brodiei]
MPQLNPSPWFSTMLAAWLILMVVQPKLLSFTFPNHPSGKPTTPTNTSSWTWPWT